MPGATQCHHLSLHWVPPRLGATWSPRLVLHLGLLPLGLTAALDSHLPWVSTCLGLTTTGASPPECHALGATWVPHTESPHHLTSHWVLTHLCSLPGPPAWTSCCLGLHRSLGLLPWATAASGLTCLGLHLPGCLHCLGLPPGVSPAWVSARPPTCLGAPAWVSTAWVSPAWVPPLGVTTWVPPPGATPGCHTPGCHAWPPHLPGAPGLCLPGSPPPPPKSPAWLLLPPWCHTPGSPPPPGSPGATPGSPAWVSTSVLPGSSTAWSACLFTCLDATHLGARTGTTRWVPRTGCHTWVSLPESTHLCHIWVITCLGRHALGLRTGATAHGSTHWAATHTVLTHWVPRTGLLPPRLHLVSCLGLTAWIITGLPPLASCHCFVHSTGFSTLGATPGCHHLSATTLGLTHLSLHFAPGPLPVPGLTASLCALGSPWVAARADATHLSATPWAARAACHSLTHLECSTCPGSTTALCPPPESPTVPPPACLSLHHCWVSTTWSPPPVVSTCLGLHLPGSPA
ncbi:hypothetical protein GPJ56_007207 [Histomonas meleagridis]|nr:hypothetical protein GPJ56_007207 [Histomonas meleagridis]